MAENALVPLADLLIDAQNPRLSQPNVGQREALRAIAGQQGSKLHVLAKDIADYGLNPCELSIVMPLGDQLNRQVVLEGNRRLTALRALENPDFLINAIPASLIAQLRRLSKLYHNAPIDSVPCIVVKDRDEARHWIELRHTGYRAGAGIIPWSHADTGRFKARGGTVEPHLQALDFLEHRGDLTPEKRKKVPATSFKRLIDTPAVRAKLGIEVRDGVLKALADEKSVAKALLHVAQELADRKVKVTDIYTNVQRQKYANDLSTNIVVTPTIKSGEGVDIAGTSTQVSSRRPTGRRTGRTKDKLIPRDCTLKVTETRIKQIETELRKLDLNTFPNSVSVLFRVFLELSADVYMKNKNLPGFDDERKPLAKKLEAVTDHLLKAKKLSQKQANPVRRACVRNSFLGPSVTLMHNYVHNPHMVPPPGDLRAHWDSLESFVIAVWAP